VTDEAFLADEFDAFLKEQLRSPSFRAAYEEAQARYEVLRLHHPLPLAINGHDYRRRQQRRTKRGRR
jgi:hypothetical protein